MTLKLFSSILIFTFWCSFQVSARDLNLHRNQIYIGPEYYHITRDKEGGTTQNGNMLGVRIGYDRLKRYGWYWGVDGIYAYGTLKGHSGGGNRLSSHLIDSSVEGRFGYTLQQKEGWQASITPFVGLGYAIEQNKFIHPSLIEAHFKTRYPFVESGFLAWMHFCNCIELGLNFKIKYPLEPKCKVTHDPEHETVTQRIEGETHYRLEVPIGYQICCEYLSVMCLVPFFEFRNYESHPNYPFNFIKTQFDIWGLRLELQSRW